MAAKRKMPGAEVSLRRKIADEILKNITAEDDCAYCQAYKHSASIALGEEKAIAPVYFPEGEAP